MRLAWPLRALTAHVSPAAPRPVAGCLAAALAVCAAGCTASSDTVRPPEDQLQFPTGVATAPDDSVLFVVNANSELRYDSGSIGVVDLAVVQQVTDGWRAGTAADGCAVDAQHRETLVCPASQFLRSGAGVRIGNFATDIAVQDLSLGKASKAGLRVLVPTRGDPSIAWADYDPATGALACGGAGFGLCDDTHRLTFVANDPSQFAIPDEPFDVFVDSHNEFAMVTHQAAGAVTLIDSPAGGAAVISDLAAGLFAVDLNTGVRAATGIAGRIPSAPITVRDDNDQTESQVYQDIVYVASRSESRVQTFTIQRPKNAPAYLSPGSYLFLDGAGSHGGGSTDTRAVRFSPGGDRMYVVNRFPPLVHIYDTSTTDTGVPRNVLTGASDICRQASGLRVQEVFSGDGASRQSFGERAYVTCFQGGEVYVVDPAGPSHVEDVISAVGRGPYAITGAPTRHQLYVTNFLEDTIAVIDVDPSSPTQNRVVLRIGIPRAQ